MKDLLRQAGRHAKRALKMDPKMVSQRTQEMRGFVPKALPEFKTQAQQVAERGAQVTKAVSKKKTPTQALKPTDLAKHLSKNPKKAIQAGRQYGAPVTATPQTLAELERTPFHKLNAAIQQL